MAYSSSDESSCSRYWVESFLSRKGHEYFCEVDEEYIVDRFNLTGLNSEVPHFSKALELILDNIDLTEYDDPSQKEIRQAAHMLYGLIHARFIITYRGLVKMVRACFHLTFEKTYISVG